MYSIKMLPDVNFSLNVVSLHRGCACELYGEIVTNGTIRMLDIQGTPNTEEHNEFM